MENKVGEASVLGEQENTLPLLTLTNNLQKGERIHQYIAAISATLGAFGVGTALAWTSPALPHLQSNTTCLNEPLTADQGAWVGSLLAIGAIIGAIPTGWLADHWGRKFTMIGFHVPALLSWILMLFGRSPWIIYVARILAGLSMGGFGVVCPMYIGEIAEVSIRGTLGSYFEVLICLGVMAVYVVGALVNYFWLNLIMGVVPLISILIFLFMPDTPTYFLIKGNRAGAESILQYFRGVKYNVGPEIAMLQKELQEARANATSIRQLLSSRANVNALVIAVGLMLAQQMNGINVVIFYTADVFHAAGSEISPDTCAVIIGCVQVVGTYVSLLLVDKAGRRILLLCSAIPAFVCTTALGAYFYLQKYNPQVASTIGWLPLIAVNVFVVAISLGLGPIPWMILGELFSSSFKGPATSAVCLLNAALVFFVTKTYVNIVDLVGVSGAFCIYSICSAIAIVFIYFKVPETKGKTFLEIQGMLSKR